MSSSSVERLLCNCPELRTSEYRRRGFLHDDDSALSSTSADADGLLTDSRKPGRFRIVDGHWSGHGLTIVSPDDNSVDSSDGGRLLPILRQLQLTARQSPDDKSAAGTETAMRSALLRAGQERRVRQKSKASSKNRRHSESAVAMTPPSREVFRGNLAKCTKIKPVCACKKGPKDFCELVAKTCSGCKKCFKDYLGKVVLVVNIATMADNAKEELLEMNCLAEELDGQNFALLAFPSNTFGDEPAEGEEICSIMSCVRPGGKFKPKFELFEKTDVNGDEEHQVFKFLKKKLPVPARCPNDCPLWIAGCAAEICWKPILRTDISGNFEKFIVNQQGCPVYRFSSRKPIKELKALIKEMVMDAACEDRLTKKKKSGNVDCKIFNPILPHHENPKIEKLGHADNRVSSDDASVKSEEQQQQRFKPQQHKTGRRTHGRGLPTVHAPKRHQQTRKDDCCYETAVLHEAQAPSVCYYCAMREMEEKRNARLRAANEQRGAKRRTAYHDVEVEDCMRIKGEKRMRRAQPAFASSSISLIVHDVEPQERNDSPVVFQDDNLPNQRQARQAKTKRSRRHRHRHDEAKRHLAESSGLVVSR